MSGTLQYKSVDQYFDAQQEATKEALLKLRAYILTAAPNATELLNYNILAYALVEGGKREQQVMIAGYRNAVGFYPHPTTMDAFAAELGEFKKGKGSVQFPLDRPLPKDLIIRMVGYRMSLLE